MFSCCQNTLSRIGVFGGDSSKMERWEGKIAIVTGASAGIGAAISKALVQKGLIVVGLARRIDKIEEVSKSLTGENGKLYALRCDVTREEDILRAFRWVGQHVGPVQILVNNAGLTRNSSLTDGTTEEWRRVFEVNVLALCICTREAVRMMKQHDLQGHVVHINSITGHHVPKMDLPLHVYPATKHAVTALTESLIHELQILGNNKIKVSSVSPGIVKTEFQNGLDENTRSVIDSPDFPILRPEDVADAVVYVLATPSAVNITELTIRPVGEVI